MPTSPSGEVAEQQPFGVMARKALSLWDLPGQALSAAAAPQLELVSVSENFTYRVRTLDAASEAKSYVLRLHRPGYHSLSELESELAFCKALNEAGVHAPSTVPARSGDSYELVEEATAGEARYAGLAHWAPGEPLSQRFERPGKDAWDDSVTAFTARDLFLQIGQVAAKIHEVARTWQAPEGFVRHSLDAAGLMGPEPFWGPFWNVAIASSSEQARLSQLRDTLYRFLQQHKTDHPEAWSLIHADLHPGNLILSERHLHVIDFDDLAFGFHAYELAVALRYYQDHPHLEAIQTGLLEGYRQIRPLSESVEAQIPRFVLIRLLASIGWLEARPEHDQSELRPLLDHAFELAQQLGI